MEIDIPGRSLRQDDLYRRKLHEQDPKISAMRSCPQGLRLVDPELGDSGDKNKKTKQKFLRRLFLLAGKDQGGQTAHKATENQESDGPCTFQSFRKLALGDRSPGFAAAMPLPTSRRRWKKFHIEKRASTNT